MTVKHFIWFLSGLCIALACGLAFRFFKPGPVNFKPGPVNNGELLKKNRVYHFDPPPMGGIPMSIKVWNRGPFEFGEVDKGDAHGSQALVEKLENDISSWRKASGVSRLNDAQTGEPVVLAVHAAVLMDRSLSLIGETGGAFNPLVGPMIKLWKDAAAAGAPPDQAAVDAAKALCRPDGIVLDLSAKTAAKNRAGARIDLGGVAKGYIIDKVAEFLMDRGAEAGIVTAGGDLRVFGDSVRKVGIRHPTDGRQALYGSFPLQQGGVATSGNYERSYVIAGKTYGHIIDPISGQPVAGPLSVTVIASDCTRADAFATAVFVLGAEKGLALAEKVNDVEALILVQENDAIAMLKTGGFPEVQVTK